MRRIARPRTTTHLRAMVLAAPLVVALCGPMQSAAQTAGHRTAEQEVMAADDDYVAAESTRQEPAIRRLIDDRFVYNDADGKTMTKDQFVRFVTSLPILGESVRERSAIVEGHVGIVFATTDIRLASPGKPEKLLTLRYTCVYVNRDGVWRMLALQTQPHEQ